MKKQTLSFDELKNLGCREFDPRVTMSQIMSGMDKNPQRLIEFLSWDIEKNLHVVKNDEDEIIGLMMKFNHDNYSELLYVTLNFLDYYNLHFIHSETKEIICSVEDVDCESLFSVINDTLNNVRKFNFSLN